MRTLNLTDLGCIQTKISTHSLSLYRHTHRLMITTNDRQLSRGYLPYLEAHEGTMHTITPLRWLGLFCSQNSSCQSLLKTASFKLSYLLSLHFNFLLSISPFPRQEALFYIHSFRLVPRCLSIWINSEKVNLLLEEALVILRRSAVPPTFCSAVAEQNSIDYAVLTLFSKHSSLSFFLGACCPFQ